MEQQDNTLKMTAVATPTPRKMTRADIKPGQLFKYSGSTTTYVKMLDGSIRNVDKAVKKHLKAIGRTPDDLKFPKRTQQGEHIDQ